MPLGAAAFIRRWEDFFRGPGVTGLRKGTLTYGPTAKTCRHGPRGTGSACALKVDLMLSAELAQAVWVA